jgi:hypothetical protein
LYSLYGRLTYLTCFQDFELRRQMLVKRMEVTVESFLWSQKAEASAGSIRAAVAAQQRHLTAAPVHYEVSGAEMVIYLLLFSVMGVIARIGMVDSA